MSKCSSIAVGTLISIYRTESSSIGMSKLSKFHFAPNLNFFFSYQNFLCQLSLRKFSLRCLFEKIFRKKDKHNQKAADKAVCSFDRWGLFFYGLQYSIIGFASICRLLLLVVEKSLNQRQSQTSCANSYLFFIQ